MPEEKKEQWLSWLALTTVILAVCTALSTFKAGGFSSRSLLAQSQASDQWAFYQAKSIKSYLYDLQADKLALEMKTTEQKPAAAAEFQKKIEACEAKVKKYEDEKGTIEKEAKKLEGIRDAAQGRGNIFGMAVIYLQIAILLSSIAALMKKPWVWTVGLASGAMGLVYFADGFLLFIK